MNVLQPAPEVVAKYRDKDSKDILAELDQIFAGDWEANAHEIADLMAALQADSKLLRNWVQDVVSKSSAPPLTGAQSFLIHRSAHMLARINLWLEPGRAGETVPEFRRYLSIDELHNHNFDFFTILLLGGGYTTDYYRDEAWSAGKKMGDGVRLGKPVAHKLRGTTVHQVERLHDYHSVEWPDGFSVSLNVMPLTKPDQEQYIVNAEDMTIKFVIQPQNTEMAA